MKLKTLSFRHVFDILSKMRLRGVAKLGYKMLYEKCQMNNISLLKGVLFALASAQCLSIQSFAFLSNPDFENRNLSGWTVLKGNLAKQPTSSNRRDFNKQGNFFVGTGETNDKNKPVPFDDKLTGQIQSHPFTVSSNYIKFYIGGGNKPDKLYIALVDHTTGAVLCKTTGNNDEFMTPRHWDVRRFRKKRCMIKIVDDSDGVWGHINIDKIWAADILSEPIFPNSDFEHGDMTGWTTSSHSNFSALPSRSKRVDFNQQGIYFIGTCETVNPKDQDGFDDGFVGEIRSQDFVVTSDYIRLLIGGGKGSDAYVALIRQRDNRLLHKARGNNDEFMLPHYWDVRNYQGQKCFIKIVDKSKGGWGHINIDNITTADYMPVPPSTTRLPLQRLKILPDRCGYVPYMSKHRITKANPNYEHAIILLHGSGTRTFMAIYNSCSELIGKHKLQDKVLPVALILPSTGDRGDLADDDIYWSGRYHNWTWGHTGARNNKTDQLVHISSFEAMDRLVKILCNKELYPAMKSITITGNSAGGQYTNRYSAINHVHDTVAKPVGVKMRYMPVNPLSYLYLDNKRQCSIKDKDFTVPNAEMARQIARYRAKAISNKEDLEAVTARYTGLIRSCNGYGYGLRGLPAYCRDHHIDQQKLIEQFKEREVLYAVGQYDTDFRRMYYEIFAVLVQGRHRQERARIYYDHLQSIYGEDIKKTQSLKIIPKGNHSTRSVYKTRWAEKFLLDPALKTTSSKPPVPCH